MSLLVWESGIEAKGPLITLGVFESHCMRVAPPLTVTITSHVILQVISQASLPPL
jgi:hypothetical protein